MTWVSSESSKPWIRVVPWAKAASNNTRLEMLFEPGSVISPDASVKGCNVRRSKAAFSPEALMTNRSCYPKNVAPVRHAQACRIVSVHLLREAQIRPHPALHETLPARAAPPHDWP